MGWNWKKVGLQGLGFAASHVPGAGPYLQKAFSAAADGFDGGDTHVQNENNINVKPPIINNNINVSPSEISGGTIAKQGIRDALSGIAVKAVGKLMDWGTAAGELVAPIVNPPVAHTISLGTDLPDAVRDIGEVLRQRLPRPAMQLLPFDMLEPRHLGQINKQAFENLAGMAHQKAMLQNAAALLSKQWRVLEENIRMEKRQRVAFLLFTGGMGTGKTSHALAFANYIGVPCAVLNPSNATFVSSQGLSMMHQVLDHCKQRKSAVILLDEIDVYAANEAIMAEVRQAVDGTLRLDNEAALYIIGTTNKQINAFPSDLIHRVLLHIRFGGSASRKLDWQVDSDGLQVSDISKFWERNALCLSQQDQKRLSDASLGCVARDLQIWVQKVLLTAAARIMKKESASTNEDAAAMDLPMWHDFMLEIPEHLKHRKAPALDFSPELNYMRATFRDDIIDLTTFKPASFDVMTGVASYCREFVNEEPPKYLMVSTEYLNGEEIVTSACIMIKHELMLPSAWLEWPAAAPCYSWRSRL